MADFTINKHSLEFSFCLREYVERFFKSRKLEGFKNFVHCKLQDDDVIVLYVSNEKERCELSSFPKEDVETLLGEAKHRLDSLDVHLDHVSIALVDWDNSDEVTSIR